MYSGKTVGSGRNRAKRNVQSNRMQYTHNSNSDDSSSESGSDDEDEITIRTKLTRYVKEGDGTSGCFLQCIT